MIEDRSQLGGWMWSPPLAGALSVASAALAGWLIDNRGMGSAARLAAALLPTPFFLLLLVAMVRWTRRLDELSRRIQLEALAITSAATATVTFLAGYLQRIGVLASRHWDDVWLVMAIIYLASWTWSARRYE